MLNSLEELCVEVVQRLRWAGLLGVQHEYADTPVECLLAHIMTGKIFHRKHDCRPPPTDNHAYSDTEKSRDSSSQTHTTTSDSDKTHITLKSTTSCSSSGIHCQSAGDVVDAVLQLQGPAGLSKIIQEAYKHSPTTLPAEQGPSVSANLDGTPLTAVVSHSMHVQ